MAAVEIADVSLDELPPALAGAAIEVPTAGDSADVHVLRLYGWVLGRESPPAHIEVRSSGKPVQTARFSIPRPDVAARAGDAVPQERCGFDFEVGTFGLGEEIALRLVVVLEDGTRVRLAWVRGTRKPVRSGFEPSIQPLLVTSPGRSGTTLMMAMLNAHPGIVMHGVYPFEFWPCKYWALATKLLTDPADHEHSTRAMWLDGDSFHLGRNPFSLPTQFRDPALRDLLGRAQIERTAAFAQQSVEDWYRALVREQGLENPPYFAEKHMDPVSLGRNVVRELYPEAKEIFLVRDFRDMAHSRVDYLNKQRIDRGKEPDNPEQSLVFLRTEFRRLLDEFALSWRRSAGSAHLIRYEDLVLEPTKALAGGLAYLGLDSSPEAIEAMIAAPSIPDRHRTTEDAALSIGRWKRDGDEAFRAACEEELGDLLVEFDYHPN
jgi:hypothetical protein